MGRLVRALGVAALALAALLLPGTPAGASTATAKYVAIVIAGQGTGCVKWYSGIDGLTVLGDVARVTPGHGPYAGFVVQINGVGKNPPDDDHYWSYWHGSGGGWNYSNVGAGSYSPAAGSVEGWSYDNGSSSAPPPPSASFASICAGRTGAQPAPTTKHTTAKAAPRKTSAHRDPTTTRAATASSPAARASGASATAAASSRAAAASSAASRSAARTSPAATASDPAASTLADSPVNGSGPLSPLSKPRAAKAGGSAVPAIVAGAVVVAIGAGGGWVALRRRRAA